MVRVTNSMLLRIARSDLNEQRAHLANLQQQASSGLRLLRPSDDPVAVHQATALRASVAEAQQLLRNQDRAEERLRVTENALAHSQDLFHRARELAIQGSNGTLDAASRQAIAAEIEQLHGELVSLANTRLSGSHLFAGYLNDTAPFTVAGPFVSGSPAPAVAFVGDPSEIQVEVESGVSLASTLDGRRVFLGDGDGDGLPDAGREDVFDVLGRLWEALDTDDPVAVANTLDGLDRAELQLSLERTRLGGVTARLDGARATVEVREVAGRQHLSEVEDADVVSVFSDLVNREASLQASLEATARLIQPTLLDFLR